MKRERNFRFIRGTKYSPSPETVANDGDDESFVEYRCKLSLVSTNAGGECMAKKNDKESKKAMPKADVEFADNGLERIALKAQKTKQNK
ncbi:hypothetical protein [Neobacillus sp. YIM B06451]|uniref:hypothetical protein n=1 Tax=Neobacillus sp. YIM B06451 TaxID=3070994 RepID=UPI00292EE286|nr:hypothetical protein [Neobacillus sp. YIM B06451]